MAEYIEREALLKSLTQECRDCEHDNVYDCEVCDFAIAMLYARHEPAADVQPVKRGHWMSIGNQYEWLKTYTCSECRHSIVTYKCNYCPDCGADMRGEENG